MLLAGAAVIVLAGCGSSASTSGGTAGSTAASAATGTATGGTSSAAGTGATASPTSDPSVGAGSLLFPVAVGNTWIYQVTTGISGKNALATNTIVSVVPVSGAHQVKMSAAGGVGMNMMTGSTVYTFYPNGTVRFPVSDASGGDILWPDAADLASGRAYHFAVRAQFSRIGQKAPEPAQVTIQGAGTATVTVPAGTFRASVVTQTIVTKIGNFRTSFVTRTWTVPGTGPVKAVSLVSAADRTTVTTTEQLVTFTRG